VHGQLCIPASTDKRRNAYACAYGHAYAYRDADPDTIGGNSDTVAGREFHTWNDHNRLSDVDNWVEQLQQFYRVRAVHPVHDRQDCAQTYKRDSEGWRDCLLLRGQRQQLLGSQLAVRRHALERYACRRLRRYSSEMGKQRMGIIAARRPKR